MEASDLRLPASVRAGSGVTIPAEGSGEATLYVVGPGTAIKRKVQLGQEIQLTGDDLRNAGRYTISLGDDESGILYVTASDVSSIAFLARPSRVPADTPGVISGTAFIFDRYQNLVIEPQAVKFELSINGQSVSQVETSKLGIASAKLDSSKRKVWHSLSPPADRHRRDAWCRRSLPILATSACTLSATRMGSSYKPTLFTIVQAIPYLTAPSSRLP